MAPVSPSKTPPMSSSSIATGDGPTNTAITTTNADSPMTPPHPQTPTLIRAQASALAAAATHLTPTRLSSECRASIQSSRRNSGKKKGPQLPKICSICTPTQWASPSESTFATSPSKHADPTSSKRTPHTQREFLTQLSIQTSRAVELEQATSLFAQREHSKWSNWRAGGY